MLLFARSAVSRLPVGAGSGAVRELAKKAVRSRKGFDPTRGWARLHERLSEVPVHLPALKKLEAPPSRGPQGAPRATSPTLAAERAVQRAAAVLAAAQQQARQM